MRHLIDTNNQVKRHGHKRRIASRQGCILLSRSTSKLMILKFIKQKTTINSRHLTDYYNLSCLSSFTLRYKNHFCMNGLKRKRLEEKKLLTASMINSRSCLYFNKGPNNEASNHICLFTCLFCSFVLNDMNWQHM